MATIMLDEELWAELSQAAARKQRDPQALAVEVLKDYLERLADEDLLDASTGDAARAPFGIEDAEAVVRRYRGPTVKRTCA